MPHAFTPCPPNQGKARIIFSSDGKKIAYSGQPTWNRSSRVVVNSVESKLYSYTWRETFSPDSRHFAYVADKRNPTRSCAMIDGKEGTEYEGNSPVGDIIFSPNSLHTAYRVLRTQQSFVVRDGIIGERYDSIDSPPAFSPDSKRLAYVARVGTNYTVIVDGKIFDDKNAFQYTGDFVFSPDSQHLAYKSRIGEKWFAVLDGVVEKQSEDIFSDIVFTPDGKRLVYLGQHGAKTSLVVGEFESKEYDKLLTCDPFLNTMGVIGPRNVAFTFDGQNKIHAMALRGDEILRLEFEIAGE